MGKRSYIKGNISRFCVILAVIICCNAFSNTSIAKGESSTGIAAKIDSICNQYSFASGKYWSYNQSTGNSSSYVASANKANTASSGWTGGVSGWVGYQFAGGSECWAFAGFVGYKLFGQTNPYASWTKYSSADAVRTNGLRAGDIIRTPNHSAVIYSIDSNGIISTVECWGSRWNEIRVHGGFNGWSLTFDQIVSKYGLSYVLHYSGNDSEILWPAQVHADTLEFRDVVYPKTFRINTTNGWFLQGGSLVSDVNLTSIRSIITRVSDGKTIDDTGDISITSGKSFNQFSKLSAFDQKVKFSNITTAGDYIWILIAKDSQNRMLRLVMPFKAVSSGTTETAKRAVAYPNSDPDVSCSHPSSTWVTVRESTADQEGLKERRCSVCGEVLESEIIPKPVPEPPVSTAQLMAAATTMQKDGTFTVTLSLANNPGIGFIVIQSNAAAQGITLEKAEGIGAAAAASVTYGTNATLSSTAPIAGESGIMLLTFKSETKEEVTLQFFCGQCFTTDEEPVAVSGTSVKVTATKRIPGDATNDGVVDGRDVLRLMKYFAGQAVTFNEANADVTGDGTVDGRDVLRLMKYFAGQNVTLQ